jgi:hypothetical protein
MGIFLQTRQRYGASRRVPKQELQLVPSMRWHLGVGGQRKPIDPGTAGARACGECPFTPKARANPSHLLSGPLTKGPTLLDSGRQGVSEGGLIVYERIIPRGYSGGAARLQVSQGAQLADDVPADRLDRVSCSAGADRSNISIGGRPALDKTGLAPLVSAIEIDTSEHDHMKVHVQIDGTAKALDKCHRPRLRFLPHGAACDRLMHVVLTNRGSEWSKMRVVYLCLPEPNSSIARSATGSENEQIKGTFCQL